jgi:hypothetical protein
MADNDYLPTTETSKKGKKSATDYIPDWVPGVGALREQKKRIEGTTTKKTKRDTGSGAIYE